jgi:hypothetical protein
MGLPLALSGGIVLTYAIESGSKKFAVRCFHREVPKIQAQYSKISAQLRKLKSPYFVDFSFQPTGIKVRGAQYPIVKMDWVEGKTLGTYLDQNSATKERVSNLRSRFTDLSKLLSDHDVAHGDIHNLNVVVSTAGDLKLIDYDGMYVPGMVGQGSEIGHRHFQHPARATSDHGPEIDRFSFIVVYLSLLAIEIKPSLHGAHQEGGEAILFKANDFADPQSSQIFSELAAIPNLSKLVNQFDSICRAPIDKVPTLSDFIAGQHIPIPPVSSPRVIDQGNPSPVHYIGAYVTLDASDYDSTAAQVGNRVELIGKVVKIHKGIGRRGRGKNKPYIFVNFGNWLGNSVKLSIWSEGLQTFGRKPDSSWEGKWISATGLIDPPYTGASYGRPYTNVGITIDESNQIVALPEREAFFRLGRRSRPSPGTVGNSKNSELIGSIPGRKTRGNGARKPKSGPTTTPNQELLKNLGGRKNVARARPPQPSNPQSGYNLQKPNSTGPNFTIPGWVWIVALIVGLVLLGNL